jgi:hypothetical protein
MIHQLRIYEIFEHNKAAFHARFRDYALGFMRRYGFTMLATWETRAGDRTEFAYLLQWPDEETMRAAWQAYLADPDWIEVKRVTGAAHGVLVGEIVERTLVLTDYSPGLTGR